MFWPRDGELFVRLIRFDEYFGLIWLVLEAFGAGLMVRWLKTSAGESTALGLKESRWPAFCKRTSFDFIPSFAVSFFKGTN